MFFVEEYEKLSMYSTMPFMRIIIYVSNFPQKSATGSIKYRQHKNISPISTILDNGIAMKLVMINKFGNCLK